MKNFYRFLLISGIVLCTYALSATNYYVSSSGNDANDGTSENLPWKSLAKVNSFKPKPGDQILFKRGDEWSGTINAKASGTSGSPIVYGAYGTGEKPKIYGSEKISGWTRHSGNIYKATVNESYISQLFLNDERMLLARYPNTGYFNTTRVNNATTFTSSDLSGSINYVGATWIGRTSSFTMHAKTVTGSSSQTITLNSAPTYSLGVGEGFFLCNKLEFLTQAGEWYYDNAANTLYLWTPNGDSPSGHEVRVSTSNYGIDITNKSYITIQNLVIAQSAETGVYLSNGDYITIDNCKIVSPDMFGVHAPNLGSNNLTVTNNYIYQANNMGIRSYSPSAIFTDNTIEDTGLLENINKRTNPSGDNFGTAIFQRERNSIIQYNRILNAGYCGINFNGTNTMVKYNFIDGACMVLDDGGGIYTYNSGIPTASAGSEIMYNVVKNVHGTNLGDATSTFGQGYGIYMDDYTTNIDILYNTVFNSSCGYFSHINKNILFQYNTSFANLIGLLSSGEYGDSYFYDNIVYSTNRTGNFTWWTNSYERLAVRDGATPVYDRNKYIHPYNSTPFRPSATQITSTEWKSNTGQDANSTFDGTPLGAGETEMLFYNDTKQTKKINLGNSVYRDLNRKQISGTLTLEPFNSKILIKTKSVINPDIEPLKITSFTIPSTATSLNIPIATLSATDNTAVIGFKLTETSTTPNAGDAGWNTVVPTTYTFNSEGTKILYAWVKDAEGNVSSSMSDQVVITLPNISDVTKPTITAFLISSTATSLFIPISSFSAIDNFGVAGYILTETSTAPNAGDAGWNTVAPTSYTFTSEGTKTLYAWVKDDAGNVSASRSDQVAITLSDISDITKPINLTSNLESKVIAWYDFEETSGTTFVDTKGNHNGTIGSDVTIKQDGSHGMAHKFSGADGGYFNWVPNHPDLTPGNSFAISTWINLSSLSVDATILDKAKEYYLLVSRGGNIELRIFEQGTFFYFGTRTDGGVIKTNTPYFIVVNVIDAINNRFEIIVNGISKPLTQRKNFERSPLGMKHNSHIFSVGGGGGSHLKTVGTISQVILFNDILTTEEITNLYNQETHVLTKSGSISESDTVNAAIIESATQGSIAFSDTEGLKNSDIFEESIIPNKANDLKLYPNPAKSIIKVDYSYMPEIGTTIEIIDSNGRTVFKKLIESTSTSIEINQYPAGLYYIRSANQHQNITKKLIIAK